MSDVVFFLTASVAGAMVFFGAVVAPTVFKTLEEAEAGRVVRALFPRYYTGFGIVTLAAAALASAVPMPWIAFLLSLVAISFGFARVWLMPAINAARDGEDDDRFQSLHRMSVFMNAGQLVALAVIAVLLAL